jgi:ribokinase
MSRPAIVVVGSLNMDFVVKVQALPAPGQTVLGSDFRMLPGGKGANQACGAGRLGGSGQDIRMIGCVGYDLFADHLKASLSAAGVDISAVRSTKSAATGIATIWVEPGGQNSIVVAPGANGALDKRDAESWRTTMRNAAWVLFQLETPLDVVETALGVARANGAETMLDPAPAQPLPGELLRHVSLLTPNETEASILLGRKAQRIEPERAHEMTAALLGLGVQAVVLKLGDAGCFYDDGVLAQYSHGFVVDAVDATAAGDTFNAALAVALAEKRPKAEALRFANAAAAISVTRMGAQASIPVRGEVDRFLEVHRDG